MELDREINVVIRWYAQLDKYITGLRSMHMPSQGNYYTLKDYIVAEIEKNHNHEIVITFEMWRSYELCDTYLHKTTIKEIMEYDQQRTDTSESVGRGDF